MKKLLVLTSSVCLIAMLLPACAPAPEQQAEPVAEQAPNAEADVAAVKAIVKQYDDALIAGDLEGWLALFVEDCVVLPPNAAILMGKDAVRSSMQSAFFDRLDMEMTTTNEEIEIAGDWAFGRGAYTFRGTPKAGGETIEDVGKGIFILKRQSDGSWKISRKIWNSDPPPAGGPTT